ncbi:ABC transporter permease [Candidatus Micrarchaeota archaeon]|nr:ABC transporter permease [Candidatus Micrarchaeota archaeon]MBU1165699.1 ABC transporter permease [Candidatus Micrarchaeota archaeon]MBU1887071.1 ABC transporter permease [Candidatus Micrarchaeota archaeon]
MDKKYHEKLRQILLTWLSLFVFILCWELVVAFAGIDRLILPSLSGVVQSFLQNHEELFANLVVTMFESVSSFLIGSVLGFLFSILFVYSDDIKNSLLPYAIALKATPLVAVAPLIILWFGNDVYSKIVMGAMVAFFPVLISSLEGLTNIEKEQLNLMKSYSATKIQVLFKLRIPNSIPFIFSSLKIASTLAVVGVMIGEFTGSDNGLGHVIISSSYYLDTPLMFAAIIMASLWGILFYSLVSLSEKTLNHLAFGM